MRDVEITWPATTVPSLLAALTTWVTLWSWAGFVESPSGYLVPVLGALVVLAATGILLRAARLGPLLVLAAQLAVLAVWLTHAWAPGAAVGGWLPTPASTREMLVELQTGVAAAQAYHAPLSDSVPQILPLLVGTGVLIGVLVDFLACGLRRAPLAGLPLLAAYTAPVSILPGGVPWWVFGASAVSFLALIATDEGQRLLSWGNRVSRGATLVDTGGGAVSTESLRSSARRIGLTATSLALVAPLLIPTFNGFLTGNGPGGAGEGGSVDLANPLVNLRRDLVRGRDVDLVSVTTDDPDPSYLRISVLDSFDGSAWAPSIRDIPPEQSADGVVARPPGLGAEVPRTRMSYRVDVSGTFRSTWLPTPYPVTSIRAPGDWRYDASTLDFTTVEEGATTAGLSYALTALDVSPRTEDLLAASSPPEAVFTPYTDLPDDLPTSVRDLARQVTSGFETKFEKAVRLQRWFRQDGGFTYSLAPGPGTGTEDLVAFLSSGPGGRVGYCEQFAAAMAVMGRAVGIPSRVAVGFLRPDRVGPDEYVYSAHDLHAWPEMYFEGVGWVRFEPTPDDRASSVPGYTAGQINAAPPGESPSASASTPTAQNTPRNPRDLDPGAAGGGGSSDGRGPWLLLGLLGTAGLLLAPRAARAAVRSRRWGTARTAAEVAEAGWAEVRDTVVDLRVPWDDSVTLRTMAGRVALCFGRPGADEQGGYVRGAARGAAANPEAARALERLVRDVERARYAREVSNGRSAEQVGSDVDSCCEALVAGATRRRRRLATWLPASLVRNGVWRAVALRPSAGEPTLEVGVDRAT